MNKFGCARPLAARRAPVWHHGPEVGLGVGGVPRAPASSMARGGVRHGSWWLPSTGQAPLLRGGAGMGAGGHRAAGRCHGAEIARGIDRRRRCARGGRQSPRWRAARVATLAWCCAGLVYWPPHRAWRAPRPTGVRYPGLMPRRDQKRTKPNGRSWTHPDGRPPLFSEGKPSGQPVARVGTTPLCGFDSRRLHIFML